MHPAADRAQAVEDGDAVGVGEEVGKGDAASLFFDLQAPAGGGGEGHGAVAGARVGAARIDRRDRPTGGEGDLGAGGGGHLPREVLEPAGELAALAGAEKAGLAFDDRAVGNDVELAVGAEQGVGGGEAVHEGGVAGDEAAGVDGGTTLLVRERLGPRDPARGGGEGRMPFPVVEPGVRRLPVRFEAPLEHPPAAGDDRLRVLPLAGLARLQHPERAGGLPPAADGGPRQLASHLLVRHHHQQQVGGRLLSAMPQKIQGAHEGREPPFHVDGAGGDQPVAVEMRLQGRQDGVEMADQQEMPARGVGSPGVEHRQGRGAILLSDLDGQPALAESRREPFRHAAEPHGIAAVGGDGGQLAEELDGPLEEGFGEIRDSRFHGREAYLSPGRRRGLHRLV